MSRHIALLLAAGKSSRMTASRPKQYMEVDGESILLHTMRAFQRHPLVDDIYVICAREWEVTAKAEAERGAITKFRSTITGGETSFQSILNGIKALSQAKETGMDDIVMVHDAVRPLVTQDIISHNIAVCLTHGNAITALGSHEAFAISKDGSTSTGYIPREEILRAQTPHTFPMHVLLDMMHRAEADGIIQSQSLFTLANEVGIAPLYIAQGNMLNFKITYPSDILVYQALKDLE